MYKGLFFSIFSGEKIRPQCFSTRNEDRRGEVHELWLRFDFSSSTLQNPFKV